MITSRLTRGEFCHAAILAATLTPIRIIRKPRLPLPEFQIGQRVRTERFCDDHRSSNYLGTDWEEGSIVGYTWQYDEWLRDELCQGWTYWIRFDKTNNQIFDDRPWLDFVHQSEIILV